MVRRPPGPPSLSTAARSAGDCLRGRRSGVGRRGRRRSRVRRRPARTPALHGAAALTGHHRERRCPHRPPPQAGMVRGPPGPPSLSTAARSTGDCLRGRRCGVGRRGRRRSRAAQAGEDAGAPWGRRSHRSPPGAPVSSPATAEGGHGPWASRPTVAQHGGAVNRRLPEGPKVRPRPARTPALQGGAGRRGRRRSMVRRRPASTPALQGAAQAGEDAGAPGGRRSRGPALQARGAVSSRRRGEAGGGVTRRFAGDSPPAGST